MDTPAPPWRRCGSCKHGRIALFTSVVQCAECLGTGIDLTDQRLQAPLEFSEVMVRTRKFLNRFDVNTLGQLLCFAMQGRLFQAGPSNEKTVSEARELLSRSGLPTGSRPRHVLQVIQIPPEINQHD